MITQEKDLLTLIDRLRRAGTTPWADDFKDGRRRTFGIAYRCGAAALEHLNFKAGAQQRAFAAINVLLVTAKDALQLAAETYEVPITHLVAELERTAELVRKAGGVS